MGFAHLGFACAGIARRLEKSTSDKLVRRLKSLWLLDKCCGKTRSQIKDLFSDSLHSLSCGFFFLFIIFHNLQIEIPQSLSFDPGVRGRDSGAERPAVEISYFRDPYTFPGSSFRVEYSDDVVREVTAGWRRSRRP